MELKKLLNDDERKLILTDLSLRIPYKAKFRAFSDNKEYICKTVSSDFRINKSRCFDGYLITSIRPVLRRMSTMTESELKEWKQIMSLNVHVSDNNTVFSLPNYVALEWLLKHHFDFQGLIEKGLAIEMNFKHI